VYFLSPNNLRSEKNNTDLFLTVTTCLRTQRDLATEALVGIKWLK